MRYPFRAAVVAALLIPALAAGTQAAPAVTDAERLAAYAYDARQPLNPVLAPAPKPPHESAKQAALRTRRHLTYRSAHGERVTAILTLPKDAKPPYPAVLLLAGSGGHKDTDYIRLAADLFSTLGYATLSLDAQYHGERSRPGMSGDIHFVQHDAMRDAWIQTVVDLRRAVDYLRTRKDVDGRRIGFMGFSQGAMIGATFLGVEPRVKAACLVVPGGGFVKWGRALGLVKPGEEERMLANAARTDPIYFIGRFAPRPLLIISAKRDEMIPRFASEALQNAANEPKTIHWYDATHTLKEAPQALVVDARTFFVKRL